MPSEAPAEVENQLSGVRHKLRRPVHDPLEYRLQPPALGRMTDRRNLAGQAQLPDQAQAVVGKRAQMQDRVVGVEFPRGQSLQIEIGLDSPSEPANAQAMLNLRSRSLRANHR